MSLQTNPFFLLIVFIVGACVGSFLNVCIYRIPRDISIVSPRSFCPLCGEPIAWYYNLPIISWIGLGGKTQCCGTPFSWRYPFVELLTASLFTLLFFQFHWATALAYSILCALLIIGFFTDLDHLMIPDAVTVGGFFLGIIASTLLPELHDTLNRWNALKQAASGAFVGAGILGVVAWVGGRVLKKEAMGMGDVKLMACLGAFLGWQATLFCIMIGSLIGTVIGIGILIAQRKKWGSHVMLPFGPPLMIAAIFWILGGKKIWQTYWLTL
ncbi:MAG: prepilin peptidase [Verrucomicrobiae bacterium]|nr:prepilin peptidase [Verrucomicrobiae bacterium]